MCNLTKNKAHAANATTICGSPTLALASARPAGPHRTENGASSTPGIKQATTSMLAIGVTKTVQDTVTSPMPRSSEPESVCFLKFASRTARGRKNTIPADGGRGLMKGALSTNQSSSRSDLICPNTIGNATAVKSPIQNPNGGAQVTKVTAKGRLTGGAAANSNPIADVSSMREGNRDLRTLASVKNCAQYRTHDHPTTGGGPPYTATQAPRKHAASGLGRNTVGKTATQPKSPIVNPRPGGGVRKNYPAARLTSLLSPRSTVNFRKEIGENHHPNGKKRAENYSQRIATATTRVGARSGVRTSSQLCHKDRPVENIGARSVISLQPLNPRPRCDARVNPSSGSGGIPGHTTRNATRRTRPRTQRPRAHVSSGGRTSVETLRGDIREWRDELELLRHDIEGLRDQIDRSCRQMAQLTRRLNAKANANFKSGIAEHRSGEGLTKRRSL